MRDKRTDLEQHFVDLILVHVRSTIDKDASENKEFSDNPDLVISIDNKVIAVELCQVPSSYIIREFHRSLPSPDYSGGKVQVHATIFPFEPHRWVHEAIVKKERKAAKYRAAASADEAWLVLHSPSSNDHWPMSPAAAENSRKLESLLMRFGLGGTMGKFSKVLYIYSDGSIVDLSDGLPESTKISPPKNSGYPAFAYYQFSFRFQVPLPGLGSNRLEMDDFAIAENTVKPLDPEMRDLAPAMKHPELALRVTVDSEFLDACVFLNEKSHRHRVSVAELRGRTVYDHMLLRVGIEASRWTWESSELIAV